jgi:hypothetical protein
VTWWQRVRRAVLLAVARVVSPHVRRLRVELAVARERHQAEMAALLAAHETRVRALNARVDELRADADKAVRTCDEWRGLYNDAYARYLAELKRTNEKSRLLGAVANVADDPAMPPDLADRIHLLTGRREQLLNNQNNGFGLRKERDVSA